MEDSGMPFQDVMRSDFAPLLFKGFVNDWKAMKWTPEYLAEKVGEKSFRCKIMERSAEVCPETECLYIECSLKQYCDWLTGHSGHDNPLKSLSTDLYSCYIDYKYMKDMFVDCPELLQEVQWAKFGFPDRNGTDSTIWIGSTSAYTPCHQDTYGFNLVTQIYGLKRWFLFSPSQTELMYPTRVPYEESSVFSEVNILCPDLTKHPLFKHTTPYIVELEPGDTLFVPRHWWHFVQCTDSSISVNTWIPMKEDLHSHLSESITRFLMSAMMTSIPDLDLCKFLNPNEEVTSMETAFKYIELAIGNIKDGIDRERIQQKSCNITEDKDEKEDPVSSSKYRSTAEECNFIKFTNMFKDFKVTKPCKSREETVCGVEKENCGVSLSPPTKKRKLLTDSLECKRLSNNELSSSNQNQILSVESVNFSDYLSLINFARSDIESSAENSLDNTPDNSIYDGGENHSSDSFSMSYKSNCDHKETFLYTVVNAVLNPNVIGQISRNILNANRGLTLRKGEKKGAGNHSKTNANIFAHSRSPNFRN